MRKQASAHANTKETYYSICCCGIRTVIKPVLCQRNGIYSRGGYIRKENTSICNLLNLLCFLFLLYKARISAFCTPCKTWNINMFKVNNKETRIRKVNDKVKNKDTVDVVLASLLLTLNTFHFLLQCFYWWLWSINCQPGLLFVVLTLVSAGIILGKVSTYGETR